MNTYTISLDTDESDLGIQHLTANVDGQTFGAIRDFILGKCTLSVGPLPQEEVSQSDSTD